MMPRTLTSACLWGLCFMLVPGPTQVGAEVPAKKPHASLKVAEKHSQGIFLPLQELIHRYSSETGNQIRLSQLLRADKEALKQLYSSRDHSGLEDFSRMETIDSRTGKKTIILFKSHTEDLGSTQKIGSRLSSSTQIIRKLPTEPSAAQGTAIMTGSLLQDGSQLTSEFSQNLSREKLLRLIKGPYRAPLSVAFFEDPDYRTFFAKLGITTPQELRKRKVAKTIRKEARKRLHQIQ